MSVVRVGLLGLGTVGGGTVNVLSRNAAELTRRSGSSLQVVSACARDLAKPRICSTDGIRLTEQPRQVVDDPEVDIVVELIGGIDAARELILRAIDQGKHVVTANKALIALHGNEIFAAAEAKGVCVGYEAAVAGGIPIIKAIREGLAGNRIELLAGIINGTGNFILTSMRDHGHRFEEVLGEAQRLGYAEADPTFDVEGIDAAHKLAILAANAFGTQLNFEGVYTEGISNVSPEDIGHAEQLGYRIKHLGIARRREDGIELRVHPTLIPERQLIANVDGVMNAVMVQGDAVGTSMFYGPGAGADATASAVVADLMDVVRVMRAGEAGASGRVPSLAFQPSALSAVAALPIEEAQTAYFLRMVAADRPGVLAEVATIFGHAGISIEAVIQPEPPRGAAHAKLVMLTHRVKEGRMIEALAKVEQLDAITGSVTRIRVEQFNAE
jgi:homoserine dehydrogenase